MDDREITYFYELVSQAYEDNEFFTEIMNSESKLNDALKIINQIKNTTTDYVVYAYCSRVESIFVYYRNQIVNSLS